MTRGIPTASLMLTLLLLVGMPLPGLPVDDSAVTSAGEHAQAVLSGSRYQRELPHSGCRDCPWPDELAGSGGGPPGAIPDGGERTARDREVFDGPPRDEPEPDEASDSSGLVRLLRFAVMGAAVIITCVFLARSLRGTRKDVPLPVSRDPEPAAPRRVATAPAGDALDELVAAGRFDEAAHLLLLQTLGALGGPRRLSWPDSWTAREYGDALALEAARQDALRTLTSTVERNLFGGLPVRREEWERCAQAAALLRVDGSGAPA